MFKFSKIVLLLVILAPTALKSDTDCTKLRVGQFLCPDPDSSYKFIDEKTQSVKSCAPNGFASGENSSLKSKLYLQFLSNSEMSGVGRNRLL